MSDNNKDFEFKGGVLEYIGVGILSFLMVFLTFGLAFPWAYTMSLRYDTNNVFFQGKKMIFKGTGLGLIGNWIKWWIFTVLTLGIYALWVYPELQKWRWRNTSFE